MLRKPHIFRVKLERNLALISVCLGLIFKKPMPTYSGHEYKQFYSSKQQKMVKQIRRENHNQCIIIIKQNFIIKMDFTANKHTRHVESETKTNHRKYSINQVSPNAKFPAYDSPSLSKPVTFARTSDKENVVNRGRNDPSLQRSPIDPLVASRQSAFQAFSIGEVEQMKIEHRAQIQTLMLQIHNLRNLLYESSQLQVQELLKIKQGYEDNNFLQMSTFRQNQNSQFEAYEYQIRKLKEQISEKGQEHKKLQSQLQRERRSNEMEKETIKQQVRLLIEKKNGQIYQLKQELDQKVRKIENQKEHLIGEIKYNSSKQLNNINKLLQSKTRELERLANTTNQGEKERQKILEKITIQKEQIQKKYQRRIYQQYEKYQNLKNNFNKLIFETTQIEENNWKQLQQMFNSQYNKIFQLVKHKSSEAIELKRQLELEQNLIKAQRQAGQRDAKFLKEKLKEQSQNFQKQIELLKVKIAVLHQTDLQKVKELYELKLSNSLQNAVKLEEQNSKLRQMLHISTTQRYELKQRHDITTSQLNAKILKMRMGIHSLQSDFKEKLQNEKSLMLMTSRSFLKEAEVKNNNNKFLEEQIRKLRQLMDLQARQNENSDKAVQEKISAAHNELQRLSSRVLMVAQQKKQLEEAIDKLRKQKDEEIARLKQQINDIQFPKFSNSEEMIIIEQLKLEKGNQEQQIEILKDKLQALESRMKQMKAEVERANMEAQINHQEGKKQYHEISQNHLKEFKKFYQQKMKRLQEEKDEFKKIIGSQYQQITELIKKYKQLEDGMKDAVYLMKKRTALQEKVMNLGMDNNLIKNLSQLLPGYPEK